MGEHFDNSAQALKDDGRSTLESMSQDELPTAPERRKPLQLFDMSFGLLIMDEAHEARNKGAAHSVCRYLAAKSAMSVLMTATPIIGKIWVRAGAAGRPGVLTISQNLYYLGAILGLPLCAKPSEGELAQGEIDKGIRMDQAAQNESQPVQAYLEKVVHGGSGAQLQENGRAALRRRMAELRKAFKGRIIRRTINSLDIAGNPISGIPPCEDHYIGLSLLPIELETLDAKVAALTSSNSKKRRAAAHNVSDFSNLSPTARFERTGDNARTAAARFERTRSPACVRCRLSAQSGHARMRGCVSAQSGQLRCVRARFERTGDIARMPGSVSAQSGQYSTLCEGLILIIISQDFYLSARKITTHYAFADAHDSNGPREFTTLEQWRANESTKLKALVKIVEHHLAEDGRPPLKIEGTDDDPNRLVPLRDNKDPRTPGMQPDKIVLVNSLPLMNPVITQILRLHNIDVYEMTGKMSMKARDEALKSFSAKTSRDGQRVLLMSEVGTVGLNIDCANVIIFIVCIGTLTWRALTHVSTDPTVVGAVDAAGESARSSVASREDRALLRLGRLEFARHRAHPDCRIEGHDSNGFRATRGEIR